MKTAFIGLGVMGYPMAGHLLKAGHDVTVYNRNAAKAAQWQKEYGGKTAPTPAEAARGQDIVFCCVGRDSDLRDVTLGPDGAFNAMSKGALFVDHTTASAGIARELATEAQKRGFGFVDAPVSGGQAGAINGKLGIMCGGSEADYARAEPVMAVYAKLSKRLGPPGSGQLTKMVNQICIAGIVQGLAEGFSLARAAGLDIKEVEAVISQGAAGSWQMENRYKTMDAGEYNHGFAVEWMRKDLGIALDEARKQEVSLPMTAMVDQFYAEVENLGGKRWDTSSLFVRQEAARKGNKG
ncbi:MAG: oxidoreductase [Alphaproteobacteria bacterium 64-11]|nr:NAD(P)-dependent oxidoreductase [Alphaproteobacteria bacterium]OJU11579.1 MAG: oxidoreductase [Alphaproteobacteria bacterium 64-11]